MNGYWKGFITGIVAMLIGALFGVCLSYADDGMIFYGHPSGTWDIDSEVRVYQFVYNDKTYLVSDRGGLLNITDEQPIEKEDECRFDNCMSISECAYAIGAIDGFDTAKKGVGRIDFLNKLKQGMTKPILCILE